ncbi:wolframin [Platysternon megacephalum]|uniref:Wolframin n=1 Tax=Platysternon megacephalum TaxID=55544 RepID=A0A4D9EJF4_9SAUR|nr:wolframin [Platysternon megacephalum]
MSSAFQAQAGEPIPLRAGQRPRPVFGPCLEPRAAREFLVASLQTKQRQSQARCPLPWMGTSTAPSCQGKELPPSSSLLSGCKPGPQSLQRGAGMSGTQAQLRSSSCSLPLESRRRQPRLGARSPPDLPGAPAGPRGWGSDASWLPL